MSLSGQILRVLLMQHDKLKFCSGYGKPGAKWGEKIVYLRNWSSASITSTCLSLRTSPLERNPAFIEVIFHISQRFTKALCSCPLTSDTCMNCTHVSASRLCQQDFSRTNSTEEFCKLVGTTYLLPYSSGGKVIRHREVVFTQILWAI